MKLFDYSKMNLRLLLGICWLSYSAAEPQQNSSGSASDPLSIRSLKRIAADNDTGLWRKHSWQLPPSGKKVAVVGAGPGGLTAA